MEQKSSFHVWTHNFRPERHACSYYRIEVPLTQMMSRDLARVYEDINDPNPMTQKNSVLALMFSDIMHQYSIAGETTLHRYQSIKRRKPAMHGETLVVPPAIIYDVDDNADFVHPFNSTFVGMGVRAYPTAKLLKPGDILMFENSKGEPEEAWVDQETIYNDTLFDIERNLYDMKVRHEIIRTSDAATVSTRALATYFRDVIGQKNVHVFPNTIVPAHYEQYDVRRKPEDEGIVRILWQGSVSHYIDWFPMREGLQAIVEKYRGKVKFVIFGSMFPWIHDIIPADMIEFHPWSLYEAYKLKRGLLNCDINLCPLKDDVFNRCKSAIKWYEASILRVPEATLAQNTEPFHEIQEGVTGLLFRDNEEFVRKLSLLIEDASLRTRLATAAKEWVLTNRTPDATIPPLFEFYQETRARQKRNLGASPVQVFSMADLPKAVNLMR
jgi:glycosyltransferase involved in cell wall biosynthesis